jgi:uncharacterized membrane protein
MLVVALMVSGLALFEAQAMHAGKQHRYAVILIDRLPGDPHNGANAINASGTVVGWSGGLVFAGNEGTGFRWTPATLDPTAPQFGQGTLEVLDPLRGFAHSEATAINSVGHAVGYVWDTDQSKRKAVLWTTGPVYLGSLAGTPWNQANSINDAGVIVGGPVTGSGTAFRWTPTVPNGVIGTMTDLGSPFGGTWSSAAAINTNGVIAGGALLSGAAAQDHAVRWDAGVPTDLGAVVPGPALSRAFGINSSRVTVGWADAGNGFEGAVWTARLDLALLDTLPLSGYKWSAALGVNGGGRVVGFAAGDDVNPHYLGYYQRAVRWHKDAPGGLEDLNDVVTLPLGPPIILTSANGVNDDGVIVGLADVGGIDLDGVLFTADVRAFVAVPTIKIGTVYGDPFSRNRVAVNRAPYFKVCDPLLVCEIVTLTNVSRQTLGGPFHVAVPGLPRGQRLANADGTYHEVPFATVHVPTLRPDESVTVILEFDRTKDGRPPVHDVVVYNGTF